MSSVVGEPVVAQVDWIDTLDGARLRVVDEGDGAAVVLVHGWKGSRRLWDECAALLVARGNRVVRYDHRWMGESSKGPGPYEIDTLARDLRHVLQYLDLDDVVLVGWSMGCSVTLRMLEQSPDRVAGLVLHNGPLTLVRSDEFPHAMPQDQLDRYLADIDRRWPEGERAFQAESLLDPNDERLLDMLCEAALHMSRPAVTEIVRSQAQLDLRDVVRGLPVPVLAAYSDHDPYYPASLAQYVARTAPRGRSHLFTNSAHCTPMEEPAMFARVIGEFADAL